VAAVVHDRGVFSCPGCGLEELSEAVAKKGRIMGRIKGIQGYESKNHSYPLVICYIAIENGPVEIVDLPMNSMVIFHSYVNVY
jgi:hypothetical protein